MKYVGAHVSAAGGVSRAPINASAIGARAFALFTRNQKRWYAPPLTEGEIESFRAGLGSSGIPPSAVLPHALSSDLPRQISRILGEWRQEADRGSLIDRLRHSLPRKVIPLEQGGGRAVS